MRLQFSGSEQRERNDGDAVRPAVGVPPGVHEHHVGELIAHLGLQPVQVADTVTTQLQKRNGLGLWFDIGSQGVKTVYSGGGSANRSNSRYDCVGSQNNQYRAWVDVDVVGVADLPGRLYTPTFKFNCD